MPQKTSGMTMTFPINVTTWGTEKQRRPDELLIRGTEERTGCVWGDLFEAVPDNPSEAGTRAPAF